MSAKKTTVAPVLSNKQCSELQACIYETLDIFFSDLDGHQVNNLHQIIIDEVEKPLLVMVMRHCKGRQTLAAETLGISRGTLRKKLKHFKINPEDSYE